MKPAKNYVKESVKADCIQTSVSIKKAQHDFLKNENLNLSRMVRDMLDAFIGKPSKK